MIERACFTYKIEQSRSNLIFPQFFANIYWKFAFYKRLANGILMFILTKITSIAPSSLFNVPTLLVCCHVLDFRVCALTIPDIISAS